MKKALSDESVLRSENERLSMENRRLAEQLKEERKSTARLIKGIKKLQEEENGPFALSSEYQRMKADAENGRLLIDELRTEKNLADERYTELFNRYERLHSAYERVSGRLCGRRLQLQHREEMILAIKNAEAEKGGHSPAAIYKDLGISRATYYRYRKLIGDEVSVSDITGHETIGLPTENWRDE